MTTIAAKEKSVNGLLVPTTSAPEAAAVDNNHIIAVAIPTQALAFLTGETYIDPTPSNLDDLFRRFAQYNEDFSDVRRQPVAKRAPTVAVAGEHNLLMLWSI